MLFILHFDQPTLLCEPARQWRKAVGLMMLAVFSLTMANTSCLAADGTRTTPDFSWLAHSQDYVNASAFPHVHTELRYASADNFLKRNVYGNFHRCYLQQLAADKFRKAVTLLGKEHPGWKFLVYDCLRPRSIQKKFYAVVKGTSQQRYVANPRHGSIHNYGLAIDLTLEDAAGHPLDMGTGFDNFSKLAEPRREQYFLRHGKLTGQQLANREILRGIMQRAGFIQLVSEWWHYDALPKKQVRAHYRIVE